MKWFRKIPGTVRAPSGLEWTLWRKLPAIAAIGTALPLLVLVILHFTSDTSADPLQERWLQRMDFVVAAVIIFHWTMVLTVGVGCFVVMVMKGPGYLADSYQVSHSDRPRATQETDAEAAHARQLFLENADPGTAHKPPADTDLRH